MSREDQPTIVTCAICGAPAIYRLTRDIPERRSRFMINVCAAHEQEGERSISPPIQREIINPFTPGMATSDQP